MYAGSMVNLQVYATSICYTALHDNDTSWRNGVLATLMKGRRNNHLDELVKAMVTYKKDFEMRIYPNAAHAFFNDTAPMYQEAAAKDAWERVLRFYKRTLP